MSMMNTFLSIYERGIVQHFPSRIVCWELQFHDNSLCWRSKDGSIFFLKVCVPAPTIHAYLVGHGSPLFKVTLAAGSFDLPRPGPIYLAGWLPIGPVADATADSA